MSKAGQWANENVIVAKKQPEKFMHGTTCAHVKPTGTLQIVVDGRSVDIPLDVAERLTGGMVF